MQIQRSGSRQFTNGPTDITISATSMTITGGGQNVF
jgi:hypothetical protein